MHIIIINFFSVSEESRRVRLAGSTAEGLFRACLSPACALKGCALMPLVRGELRGAASCGANWPPAQFPPPGLLTAVNAASSKYCVRLCISARGCAATWAVPCSLCGPAGGRIHRCRRVAGESCSDLSALTVCATAPMMVPASPCKWPQPNVFG
jgi:hypothetical protein